MLRPESLMFESEGLGTILCLIQYSSDMWCVTIYSVSATSILDTWQGPVVGTRELSP